jgi:hypothetical protein
MRVQSFLKYLEASFRRPPSTVRMLTAKKFDSNNTVFFSLSQNVNVLVMQAVAPGAGRLRLASGIF